MKDCIFISDFNPLLLSFQLNCVPFCSITLNIHSISFSVNCVLFCKFMIGFSTRP